MKALLPVPVQAKDGEKPAGHTGEGSGSIVAALAHHQRWVDQLVNRVVLSDAEPDPDVKAG